MTFELILFLTFLFYHFSAGLLLSAGIIAASKFLNWQPSAKMAYALCCSIFVLVTVLPIAQTFLQAGNLSEAMAENLSGVSSATSSVSVEATTRPATFLPNVLVSNTTNEYDIANQLAYILTPVIQLLFSILIIGIAVCVIRTFRLSLKTSWLIYKSQEIELPTSLRSSINFPVKVSSKISMPMAAGIMKPVIILPEYAISKFSEEQLLHVLLHEQAHIQRHDIWASIVIRLVTALYWWSPIVGLINQKISLHREMCCDERAAATSGDNVGYAQSLLDCAKLSVGRSKAYLGAELVSYKSDLSYRISGLLQFKASNNSRSLLLMMSVLALLILAALYNSSSQILKSNPQIVRLSQQHLLMEDQEAKLVLSAINNADKGALEALLASGVNLNAPIDLLGTPLMIAVNAENDEILQTLLQLGADPNQGAVRRGSPLIVAAINGNLTAASLLLDAGADINAIIPRDETALIKAARYGQLDMVKYLIQRGADANLGVRTSFHDGFEFRTALSRARDEDTLSYLRAISFL